MIVLGGFNADPSKPNLFGDELTKFLQEESYILSDVVFCDKGTYTFYSDAQLSTSWIDHCMYTRSFHTLIHSAKVHYEMISSDHFPLGMKLEVKVPHSVPNTCDSTKVRRVKWSDLSEPQREAYRLNTEQNLSKAHLNLTLLMCEDTNCTDPFILH